MKPRIYADFNKWDADKNSHFLILTCRGTFDDLAKNKLELEEGLALLFRMDDADSDGNYDELEADGICHFDPVGKHWIGRVNWNAVRHASDLRLLYNHIVKKSPEGIAYTEAVKLMLCLYCTLGPLPQEMQKLKLTKEALAEVFSRLAVNGKIIRDDDAHEIPSDAPRFDHWEGLVYKFLHGPMDIDKSFIGRASQYV